MSLPLAIVGLAIEGIKALKDRDDSKRKRQEDINAAEEKMWNDRNEQIRSKIAAMEGRDPNEGRFSRNLELFRKQVDGMEPVDFNWAPVVRAGANVASAAYDAGQKPDAAAPSGRDVPGKNFSPSPNYTPAVNYSEWEPVKYEPHERNAGGGYIRGLADKYDDEDAQQWWRR